VDNSSSLNNATAGANPTTEEEIMFFGRKVESSITDSNTPANR